MSVIPDDERTPPAPRPGVDAICDAFEAEWFAGNQPRIEDFLQRGGDAVPRDELLRELLISEWDLRRRQGAQLDLETYHARFPECRFVITDLWRAWTERQSENRTDEPPVGSDTTKNCGRLEEPVTVIGRYKLLEKLGEGGFGTVWAAEQREPVKRRVALKVIKLGMDTEQVVARFEAERQALALMDHPNIAKVLDAGATETGRPYFVMELVKGVPITGYCDENQLTSRERLELFVEVCHAVQHAHHKGIIHRDLKPSNVLVAEYDEQAVAKVIDFGVAKALHQALTEKTVYTHFGQLIGTLDYMSPEQAKLNQLDIDTRSDVYSLGVLLYELLTGTTPFDKKLHSSGLDVAMRIIREEVPPKPSTRVSTMSDQARTILAVNRKSDPKQFRRLMRGELDWIVMKAMEKERARRYDSAGRLAMDVLRYLSDEPVQACPPSAGYRLRKFLWRHKRPVSAALLILMALVAGVIGTTWGLISAERNRDELAKRNQALEAAHEHERLLNERARQAIETVTSETAIEQLTRQQELRPEQKDFLDKMIQFYAESAQDVSATEQERTRQAQAYHRMGRLNQVLGRVQDSESAYRRAVALGQQLAADFPNRSELRLELAMSRSKLGSLFHENGRLKEAESAFADAMTIFEQLAADFPTQSEFRQGLAGIHNNLGNVFYETGRLKEAEDAHAEALAIRKQLAADDPKGTNVRRALAMSHNNLGWLFQCTGRLEKAKSAFSEAVAIQREQAADVPGRPEFRMELAKYLVNLGNLLRDTQRPKEAAAAHAEARAIYKELIAEFPNRPEFQRELADAVGQRGQIPAQR